MPDLHRLLSDAAGEPASPLDLDEVLRLGARRTRRRRALVGGAAALPVVVAATFLLHGAGSPQARQDQLVPASAAPTAAPTALPSAAPTALPSPVTSGVPGSTPSAALPPRPTSSTPRTTAPATPSVPATTRTVRDVSGTAGYAFTTPSRGTTCQLLSGRVSCEVRDSTWALPPKPADCEFDWGGVVQLEQGAATLACYSDTAYDPANPVVAYGTTVVDGDLSCDVDPTGVTCRDARTGARFSVSRAAYRLS